MQAIIDILKHRYPQAPCALHYGKDYELMIAVRLSAQCTDARVNLVTPALFQAYPTLEAMANADIADVERYIHSCGFYRQKAKDIVLACRMLIEEYDSKVPDTMEDLLRLPGVGRKTANLLLGDLYSVPGSVVCDTHCIRICGRLGLSQGKEPEAIIREFLARDRDCTEPDQWQSQIFARVLARARVIYLSTLPDETVKAMNMIPAHSIEEALSLAKGLLGKEDPSLTLIPDGVAVMVSSAS